ncbi:MAG: alpha amylase C-terminal domain-containing protein, partial [Polyangia bacterium]|nr:alpha amylase C-terminal domain-containing protein [Polyangia bacterium]
RSEPALHEGDTRPQGFSWIDCCDWEHSIVSLLRTRPAPEPGAPNEGQVPSSYEERLKDAVVAVFNFTPVPRHGYRVGLPLPGKWRELLNSDSEIYGGSGVGNGGLVETEPTAWHGQPHSTMLSLPPLGVLFLKLA